MSDFRKLMSIMEESPYDNRVNQIANQVISAHETTPFTNSDEIKDFVDKVAQNVVDYRMGGDSRRDFIKDVTKALKGKIKKPASARNVQPKNNKDILTRLSRVVNDAIGNSFPDGDPTYAIQAYFKRNNLPIEDMSVMLDKVAKMDNFRNFQDMMSSMWDSFATDNPENSLNVNKDNNPYRSN